MRSFDSSHHSNQRRGRGPRPPMSDATFEPGRPLGPGERDGHHPHDDRGYDNQDHHGHGQPGTADEARGEGRGRRGPGPRRGFGGRPSRGFDEDVRSGGPGFGLPGGFGFSGRPDGPGAGNPGEGRDFRGPGSDPRSGEGDPRRGPGRGHGRGPGRGSRAGRGDIRGAVLMLLQEEPMHGYQLIQEIAKRSGNRWSPSPGAIYPALNLLEDEGLITITADSGRKLASLTDEGTAYVEANAEALKAPWTEATGRAAHPARALRDAMEGLGGAAHQIARTGSDEQAAQAVTTLEKARRELYLILAGEIVHPAAETDTDGSATPSQD